MLDFTSRDLARFRAIGEIVGFPDRPPTVLTALALSGSAAQGKVQSYPGDCDYFERIHITAPTREEACAILADVIREKALATRVGPTLPALGGQVRQLPVRRRARRAPGARRAARSRGRPTRSPPAGSRCVRDGQPETDHLGARPPADPGWCKLDWIVADPARRALANASNMLDVTWEAPDGTITALDGFIDPYFQEVYLEAESLPLFTRLVERALGRRGRRLRGPARARGRQVHDEGPELRQGRPAAVQHLPADRPLRRGGLPAGALRRADHGALPGRRADPHARRGGPARRRASTTRSSSSRPTR